VLIVGDLFKGRPWIRKGNRIIHLHFHKTSEVTFLCVLLWSDSVLKEREWRGTGSRVGIEPASLSLVCFGLIVLWLWSLAGHPRNPSAWSSPRTQPHLLPASQDSSRRSWSSDGGSDPSRQPRSGPFYPFILLVSLHTTTACFSNLAHWVVLFWTPLNVLTRRMKEWSKLMKNAVWMQSIHHLIILPYLFIFSLGLTAMLVLVMLTKTWPETLWSQQDTLGLKWMAIYLFLSFFKSITVKHMLFLKSTLYSMQGVWLTGKWLHRNNQLYRKSRHLFMIII